MSDAETWRSSDGPVDEQPLRPSPRSDEAGGRPGAYGRAMTRHALAVATVVTTLALMACGESQEESAQQTVCDARQDISNRIDDLKNTPVADVNVDTVTETVSAIQSDLTQIKDAREDLSDERRQEIESANQAFESQVKGVVKDIGTSLTASDAASTISSAVQQLADSYEQTFARIDCS
jgi:uncharacterized membrane-anchored protein YjiN (DUF445 family)